MKYNRWASLFLLGVSTVIFQNTAPAPLTDAKLKSALEKQFKAKSALERDWIFRSLKFTDELARVTAVYAPSHLPTEKNPHYWAYHGIALVKAHKLAKGLGDVARQTAYKKRIDALAASLVTHANFDDTQLEIYKGYYGSGHANTKARGLTGWGMFYNAEDEDPKNIYQGGYTVDTTIAGCDPRTAATRANVDRAYQELAFSTSYVVRFLLEAYRDVAPTKKWLQAARAALDSYANFRWEATDGTGHAYFYKTTGPCSRTMLIKNINMLMGTAFALGHAVAKVARYGDIAKQIYTTNNWEVRRGNFGYYSWRHQNNKFATTAAIRKKIDGHQDSPGRCKSASCTLHLSLEGQAYVVMGESTGWWAAKSAAYSKIVLSIFDEFTQRVRELDGQRPEVDYASQAVAQLCYARNLPVADKAFLDIKKQCEENLRVYANHASKPSVHVAISFLTQ